MKARHETRRQARPVRPTLRINTNTNTNTNTNVASTASAAAGARHAYRKQQQQRQHQRQQKQRLQHTGMSRTNTNDSTPPTPPPKDSPRLAGNGISITKAYSDGIRTQEARALGLVLGAGISAAYAGWVSGAKVVCRTRRGGGSEGEDGEDDGDRTSDSNGNEGSSYSGIKASSALELALGKRLRKMERYTASRPPTPTGEELAQFAEKQRRSYGAYDGYAGQSKSRDPRRQEQRRSKRQKTKTATHSRSRSEGAGSLPSAGGHQDQHNQKHTHKRHHSSPDSYASKPRPFHPQPHSPARLGHALYSTPSRPSSPDELDQVWNKAVQWTKGVFHGNEREREAAEERRRAAKKRQISRPVGVVCGGLAVAVSGAGTGAGAGREGSEASETGEGRGTAKAPLPYLERIVLPSTASRETLWEDFIRTPPPPPPAPAPITTTTTTTTAKPASAAPHHERKKTVLALPLPFCNPFTKSKDPRRFSDESFCCVGSDTEDTTSEQGFGAIDGIVAIPRRAPPPPPLRLGSSNRDFEESPLTVAAGVDLSTPFQPSEAFLPRGQQVDIEESEHCATPRARAVQRLDLSTPFQPSEAFLPRGQQADIDEHCATPRAPAGQRLVPARTDADRYEWRRSQMPFFRERASQASIDPSDFESEYGYDSEGEDGKMPPLNAPLKTLDDRITKGQVNSEVLEASSVYSGDTNETDEARKYWRRQSEVGSVASSTFFDFSEDHGHMPNKRIKPTQPMMHPASNGSNTTFYDFEEGTQQWEMHHRNSASETEGNKRDSWTTNYSMSPVTAPKPLRVTKADMADEGWSGQSETSWYDDRVGPMSPMVGDVRLESVPAGPQRPCIGERSMLHHRPGSIRYSDFEWESSFPDVETPKASAFGGSEVSPLETDEEIARKEWDGFRRGLMTSSANSSAQHLG